MLSQQTRVSKHKATKTAKDAAPHSLLLQDLFPFLSLGTGTIGTGPRSFGYSPRVVGKAARSEPTGEGAPYINKRQIKVLELANLPHILQHVHPHRPALRGYHTYNLSTRKVKGQQEQNG